MMNKSYWLVMFSLMVFSATSNAALSRYTFTGYVTAVADTAGAASLAGVSTNSQVTYNFLVDSGQPGTYTRNNNITTELLDTFTRDYFYADLESGSLIDEINGGNRNSPIDILEHNNGYERIDNTNRGFLIGGSGNNSVQISSNLLDFSLWGIGFHVEGFEQAFDEYGSTTSVQSYLRLSNITSVPIPAAAWLFGSALIGFLTFSARRAV